MTPGTMLFISGIAVFGVGVILSLGLMFTASSAKRKIDIKMKEKY